MRVNIMATNDGTLTQLYGIDGAWMTGADLLELARKIHQLQIDGQRLANEPVRHPATPGYFEYPDLTDHAVYRHAEEKIDD